MLAGINPIWQSLLGTLFTWGLTAAGAGLVFVFRGGQRKVLDSSLGFAAGVMVAASYWSLLAPAIEMAENSGLYGGFVFVPVSFGFLGGAMFVYCADLLLPLLGVESSVANTITQLEAGSDDHYEQHQTDSCNIESPIQHVPFSMEDMPSMPNGMRHRRLSSPAKDTDTANNLEHSQAQSWKRILLLIIAITVHNIPEGLAVGVGFGAIGKSPSATFENAFNLAVGIGIQNFPEGLAVSLPLRAAGMGTIKSFWYGQLSGMVEPLAGLFGTVAVVVAEPLLPYALAFAAGAMIYVVVDDIIPEACSSGNRRLSSFGVIVGFLVMMSLDVGLG